MKTLTRFCIACVKCYQWVLSPIFISLGVQCRFLPSCSEYAIQAFRFHGPFSGGLLAFCRLMRCHPFCRGGIDPVPLGMERRPCSHG